MGLNSCILAAKKNKSISEKYAKQADELYKKNLRYYKTQMPEVEAEQTATEVTMDMLKQMQANAENRVIRQAVVQRNIMKYMDEYGDGTTPAKAMQALVEQDEISNYTSLQYRQKSYHGILLNKMEEAILQFGKKGVLGVQGNQPLQRQMIKALFGEEVEDAAAVQLSQAWKEASELARTLFNKMGGQIPKRSDWGLSQIHDPYALERVGFDDWYDFIVDRLDHKKMYSERTGQLLKGEELKDALKETFDTIRSEGWSTIEPSAAIRGRSLANRHLDHRFLVFKDADSWMDYQTKFGDPNAFNNMMNHLERMSRQIALLETFGPNPNATVQFIENTVKNKSSTLGKSGREQLESQLRQFRQMLDIYEGKDQAPMNGPVARSLQATRNILQAAQLGAAAISAIGDLNTQRIAAKMAGIPVTKLMTRIVSNIFRGEDATKAALRLGLIADNYISTASTQHRYFGEVSAPGISSLITDKVLRLSGLSGWTQAGRFAFGMEFMGHLADNVGKNFDQIDKPLQTTLARYGLDTRWDQMRKTKLYEHEGSSFLRPDDMRAADPDLSLRVLEMINRETDFAVPTTSIRGKAFLGGATKPGTFMGEVVRSAAMYKNYSVTLFHNNIMRTIKAKEYSKAQQGLVLSSKMSRANNMMDLFIGASLMGGLAVQLKEISKGRDPRKMDTADFIGASILQGGALGIFGDFLTSSTNRYGGGLGETLAGPVIGLGSDLLRLSAGNIQELIQGDDTNFIKEITRFTGRYTPGQSIWYLNLAFRRLALENLEEWADPKARSRFNKQMNKYQRETGQDFWWAPGERTPRRAPEISEETLLD